MSENQAALEWDVLLRSFPSVSYLQSYRWGLYRSQFGWQVMRWVATDAAGTVLCMLQAMFRRYPGNTGLLWAPGGPTGDLHSCDSSLHETMIKTINCKRLYCRLNLTRCYLPEDALKLRAHGWRRAILPLTSGLSLQYDPSKNEELLLENCSANWRHNLRRAGKRELTILNWANPDAKVMTAMYASMQAHKNIGEQFSTAQLSALLQILADDIVIYRCDDAAGEPVSLRGCVVRNQYAWDLFAATTTNGRKLYASNILFWELMNHCRRIGVNHYDLGGVDPQNNRGVYDFKKGTGAVPLEYLGEWDWSTSNLLQTGANWLISKRRSFL